VSGLLWVINKLGETLAQMEQELQIARARIAELEAPVEGNPDA
jgi:hypothetical protein